MRTSGLSRLLSLFLCRRLAHGIWCGLSSGDPAASCLGAYNCGYQNRAIWIQPGAGQAVFQVYCGSGGLTLAMLINGADATTFAYASSYWSSGWWAGMPLANDPNQYSSYVGSFTNAIFQSYNVLSASSFTMSISGATPITIPLSFSSLRSLFSGSTQTTSLAVSQWQNFVPYQNAGGFAGCVQGINVATCANPNSASSTNCCQMRIGMIWDEPGYGCIHPDVAIGVGGWCWYGPYGSVPAAFHSIVGGGGGGEYAGARGAYVQVWIPGAAPPPCCQAGYYCPTLWGGSAQYICPAGYYCPSCSTTYVDKPCLELYWGPAGNTVPTCNGLCSDQPPCPTQTRTASQSPTITRTQTRSLTPSQTQTSTCCLAGYYCPKPGPTGPFGDGFQPVTAQFLCPAGYYCPACSSDYSGTPCQPGYWGKAGQTSPFCEGLCKDVSGCPSDTRTPSQTWTPGRTPSSTPSLTPSLSITTTQSGSASMSGTRSNDASPSQTQSISVTATASNSISSSQSATRSQSETRTPSVTSTTTPSETCSPSQTRSPTQSQTRTKSLTPPSTPSTSPTASQTVTRSRSESQTVSQSSTQMSSVSSSPTRSSSQLGTSSSTSTASETQTSSLSGSPSPSTSNVTVAFIPAPFIEQAASPAPLSNVALTGIGIALALLIACCFLVACAIRRRKRGKKVPLMSSSSVDGQGDGGFSHDNPFSRSGTTQPKAPVSSVSASAPFTQSNPMGKLMPHRLSTVNPHLAIPIAPAPEGAPALPQGRREMRKSVVAVSMPKRHVGRAPSTRGRPNVAGLMPPVDFAPAAAGSGTTQPAESEPPSSPPDVALAPQEELALQAPSEAEPRDDGPASAAGLEDVAPAAAPPRESRHSKVRRDAPLPSSRTLLLRGALPSERLETETVKLRPVNRKSIALQRREQATFTAVTRRVIDFVEESAGKMWNLPTNTGPSVHGGPGVNAGSGMPAHLTAGPSAALWMRKPTSTGLKKR